MINQRNTNIEILRIVAMFMIVGYHYVVHGHPPICDGCDNVIIDLFSMWGKIGVNIFCVIMGYFGIKSCSVGTHKLLRIECQVLFYSYLGLLFALIMGLPISVKMLAYSFFPTITEHYWFFSAYIIVFLFSKFFNDFLIKVNQQGYLRMLFLCYMIWGVIPFISLREFHGMFWSQLIWFFVMYFTGAYLRLYPPKIKIRTLIIILLLSVICMILSFVTLENLSHHYKLLANYVTYFRWSNSPTVVLISISLFCIASRVQIKENKIINFVASCVFGIYLLHENLIIRPFLWDEIFVYFKVTNIGVLVLHYVFSIALVFMIGLFTDFLRKQLERLLNKPLKRFAGYIDHCIDKLISCLANKKVQL